MISDENSPPGILLSANVRAWAVDDINAWLESRKPNRPHNVRVVGIARDIDTDRYCVDSESTTVDGYVKDVSMRPHLDCGEVLDAVLQLAALALEVEFGEEYLRARCRRLPTLVRESLHHRCLRHVALGQITRMNAQAKHRQCRDNGT